MSLDEEGTKNFLNSIMSIWISPEIEKRRKEGKIDDRRFYSEEIEPQD
ncbi:MAG: hypothetical protein KGI27_03115 [Thaumarchaeota archaeon]|nr:hypothetical protein [Nitrososphaerota archaeon]